MIADTLPLIGAADIWAMGDVPRWEAALGAPCAMASCTEIVVLHGTSAAAALGVLGAP